jgi:hypothetical protein
MLIPVCIALQGIICRLFRYLFIGIANKLHIIAVYVLVFGILAMLFVRKRVLNIPTAYSCSCFNFKIQIYTWLLCESKLYLRALLDFKFEILNIHKSKCKCFIKAHFLPQKFPFTKFLRTSARKKKTIKSQRVHKSGNAYKNIEIQDF